MIGRMIRHMVTRLKSDLHRLRQSQSGTVCIELAVATPIFTSLMLGGVDATRYVLVGQKTERAAASIADLVSQAENIKESDLADLFNVAGLVMAPFVTDGRMQVLVTCINNPSGTAKIAWQRSWGGTANGSAFGVQGGNATLPGTLIVRTGETTLATEVFYDYESVFVPVLFPDATFYRWSVFRPRFSNLDTISPG